MALLENLKVAVYEEWTDDPPAGETRMYYIASGETSKDLAWPIGEIVSHITDAIGYEDPDFEDEDYEDEDYDEDDFDDEIDINGLDPTDDDGNIAIEDIKTWSWDNGGAGCGCTIYAEGKDIVPALEEFFEENLYDDLEEPDFDPDDEDVELEFDVMISLGGGDGGNVSVPVSVSHDELELLTICAVKNEDIASCEGLEDLVERISNEALDESQSIADDMGEGIELDNATCIIANPIDPEEYNSYTASCIVEYAKKHRNSIGAVEMLVDMLSELIEEYNDSMF